MAAAPRIPTVILALDRQPQQWALEAALTLARQLHGRIEGLFVEDLNLLRLAQLPFSTEIAALTAQQRPLSRDALEQALRSQANQLRQLLATQAEFEQIEWRFSVVRDHMLRALCSAARQADLFIMQGTRLRPPGHRGAIAVLYDGEHETIETAAHLARGNTLHVLLTAVHDGARKAIAAHLQRFGIQPLFVTIADNRISTLRAVVDRHHLAVLVLHAAVMESKEELFRPLLENTPCTILIRGNEERNGTS